MRQWLTDLKELEAPESRPSKETVMHSLKTGAGSIRDLRHVQDIPEFAGTERSEETPFSDRMKGGRLDADTCLSDNSAVMSGAKGEGKGSYSASVPCRHFDTGACARGDRWCRFSHRESGAKSGGKRGQGRSMQSVREHQESTTLGHVVYRNNLSASRTDAGSSSTTTEAMTPGLPSPAPRQPDANSQENAAALAAIVTRKIFGL